MKSFKQFLIEMESSDPTDSSQRNNVPPGSITPPKMPHPTRLDPDSLPAGHSKPGDRGNPENIDWQEVDEEIQGLLSLFRQLMQLFGTLPWDQFVEYMRTHYGNTNLNDRYDFEQWFENYSRGRLQRWFNNKYPDATIDQMQTFLERLFSQYGYDLWQIFDKEYFPSEVPETEGAPQGPSQRDRDRAHERWERQHP